MTNLSVQPIEKPVDGNGVPPEEAIDALTTLATSPSFSLFLRTVIADELRLQDTTLRESADHDLLMRAQGAHAALRKVIDLSRHIRNFNAQITRREKKL